MAVDRQPIEKLAASVLVIRRQLEAMEGELAALLEGAVAESEPPKLPSPVAGFATGEEDPGGGTAAGSGPDVPEPAPEPGPEAEEARLLALNMALNGSTREETDRYLSENFSSLSDRAGLLDEVYASVQA